MIAVKDRTDFAERFKQAREARGHSRREAAEEVGCAGMTIYQWEHGREPGPLVLREAAARYIARGAEAAKPPTNHPVPERLRDQLAHTRRQKDTQ